MNILLTNQHSFNVGDDSAGIALINQIKQYYPDSIIHIIYNSSKKTIYLPIVDDKIIHHDIYISRANIKHMIFYVIKRFLKLNINLNKYDSIGKYIELVRKSDIVFFSPAGANIGVYKRWTSLFRVLVPTLEKKNVIFNLNTIGKSGNLFFDSIAKYVLKRNTVFVRENKSKLELKNWKINSIQGVDTAFSLGKCNSKPIIEGSYVTFIPTEIEKWFKVFELSEGNKYIFDTVIPTLVEQLSSDQKIILLPHLTDYNGWYEKEYFNQIVTGLITSGLKADRIVIYNKLKDYIEYDNIISNSKLVLSMRYHGLVFAAKNAVPFIALSYENKMKEVCIYTDNRESYIDLRNPRNFDFQEIYSNIVKFSEKITSNLIKMHDFLEHNSRLPVINSYLEYLNRKGTK
jgi:polysaccharide pyruvyl transferase WcaK-like protein